MLIVGLTGTTGSGKGYIGSLICDDDIFVIDTDAVYHAMISSKTPCVDALCNEFGREILNDAGGIDRAALSKIVFSDPLKLEALNRITHHMILSKTREIIAESDKKIAIVDAPLLFESGFNCECDITIGVTAPADIRKERIMKRDSISCERAEARMANQRPDSYFEENCDIIIRNNGDDITNKVNEIKRILFEKYEEKKKKEQTQA